MTSFNCQNGACDRWSVFCLFFMTFFCFCCFVCKPFKTLQKVKTLQNPSKNHTKTDQKPLAGIRGEPASAVWRGVFCPVLWRFEVI